MKKTAFLLVLLTSLSYAGGGDITSNGGVTLIQNFKLGAQKICRFLTENPKVAKAEVAAETFCAAVRNTEVFVEEKTILHGQEVDAINTPSLSKIVLSRSRNQNKEHVELTKLAVHEYLFIIGILDRDYETSGALLTAYESNLESHFVDSCEVLSSFQIHQAYPVFMQYDGFTNKFTYQTWQPRFISELVVLSVINLKSLPFYEKWMNFSDPLANRLLGSDQYPSLEKILEKPKGFTCQKTSAYEECARASGDMEVLKKYLLNPRNMMQTLLSVRLTPVKTLDQAIISNSYDFAKNTSPGRGQSGSVDDNGAHYTTSRFYKNYHYINRYPVNENDHYSVSMRFEIVCKQVSN